MVDQRGGRQGHPSDVVHVERQPFLAVRDVVCEAVERLLDGCTSPSHVNDLVQLSEADRPRLALGFDYSVPCMMLGRSLGSRPQEAAALLADEMSGLQGSAYFAGAESDGPYLNLRLARGAFVIATMDALESGTLGMCSHSSETRRGFCLVRAGANVDERVISMLGVMASNCSGQEVERLTDCPADNESLVSRLVSSGVADEDPSGLTSAVMMGGAGERFLLLNAAGKPTDPLRIAACLGRRGDRVVLLSVGSGDLELVAKVEAIAGAVGLDLSDIRVIEARKPWRRLLRHLSPNPGHAAEALILDIRDDRWIGLAESEEAFAVIRGLARLADVNHRALATAEPDALVRFVKDLRRRLEVAETVGTDGIRLLRSGCAAAFAELAGATVPDA